MIQKRSFSRLPVPTRLFLVGWIALSAPDTLGRDAETPTLREGDSVFAAELVDENGDPTALSDSDRPTLLTFIFTRCAAMEFCPRMNQSFEEIQKGLKRRDGDLRLLSITLDPEFDRPERMKAFSETVGADPSIWTFATGDPGEIDRLTEAFRIFRERKDGVLNHTLCTAWIDPDGTIRKIWRGNRWEAEDVFAEMTPQDG